MISCLSIGLVMRDLQCIQFQEESSSTLNPVLQASKLAWPHYEALVNRCASIEQDLNVCLKNIPGEIKVEPWSWPLLTYSTELVQMSSPRQIEGAKKPDSQATQ
jgi:hypothetical protein